MITRDFTSSCIDEAKAIVKANYEKERQFVPILPEVNCFPDLAYFADNGLGTVAFEDGKMVGLLCCYEPWNNAFCTTKAKGTFAPIHAHGTVFENRERIYKRLYQAAAEKWVRNGVVSHAVALYAHDKQGIHSFFTNGFGLRCVDAIRPMESIHCPSIVGYSFCELDANRKEDILPLKNRLIAHLGGSPSFMLFPQIDKNDLQIQFDRRKPRYFVSYKGNELVAWLEIINSGENFACDDACMKNICGAFCLPEHRSQAVYQNLLNYAIKTFKSEGYTRLGVDFESFNPTAYGFWMKYFTAYTHSVVRRIDENILALNE